MLAVYRPHHSQRFIRMLRYTRLLDAPAYEGCALLLEELSAPVDIG